jgi:lysophosphatidate acyltransferase
VALSGTVFIDRRNRSTAFAAFDGAAKEMLTHRQSVFIFPEGTRSYSATPDLLPFKKGAFHLAIKAQVPIVPIVVANYSDVLSVKRKVFRAGTIPVRVLKPVETRGLGPEDVDALTSRIREDMLKVLNDLTKTAREKGVVLGSEEAIKIDRAVKVSGRDVQSVAAS